MIGSSEKGRTSKRRCIGSYAPTELNTVLNLRSYRCAIQLAFRLAPALGAASFLSCQSSAEQARNEMERVYRSAKLLREQLKAGATLAEFNRLRGNFATELSIINDRMQAKPGPQDCSSLTFLPTAPRWRRIRWLATSGSSDPGWTRVRARCRLATQDAQSPPAHAKSI